MPDPTSVLGGLPLLALGALGGAVAAFWQQLKSIFGYVSSFVVVTAFLDDRLSDTVLLHLKKEWTPLPSGVLYYAARWIHVRGRGMVIPFRMTSPSAVYFRKGQFLIASGTRSKLTLMAPRGLINFDKLMARSLDTWEGHRHEDPTYHHTRFQIYRVMGQEKGMYVRHTEGATASRPGRGDNAAANGEAHSIPPVDMSVDKSFLYRVEEYTASSEEDPFETLYFEDRIVEHVASAVQWMKMEDWYKERRIPWRMGWLLYGPGGTGKSSMAKALAVRLGIPIYRYFLGTLSDREFTGEWGSMVTPCIALMEDIDAVYKGRINLTEHKSLSFDTVLNAISGVDSEDGIFVILTSNHPETIDPAMGVASSLEGVSTRPGRIDVAIELGAINAGNRAKMAASILRDWPGEQPALVEAGEGAMPVQFQEMCIQRAYALIRGGGLWQGET